MYRTEHLAALRHDRQQTDVNKCIRLDIQDKHPHTHALALPEFVADALKVRNSTELYSAEQYIMVYGKE